MYLKTVKEQRVMKKEIYELQQKVISCWRKLQYQHVAENLDSIESSSNLSRT